MFSEKVVEESDVEKNVAKKPENEKHTKRAMKSSTKRPSKSLRIK